MNAATTKKLAKKVAALLPHLDAQGTVYFFALGQRGETNQWDVIVSAEWSDHAYAASVRLIADALVARLEQAELLMLASVVVIPSTEPNITDMPKNLESMSPEDEKIVELTLLGLEVRRAYIFRAQPSHKSDLASA